MQKICTGSSLIKTNHKEVEEETKLPLTEKLFAIDIYWERENQFTPVEGH